MNHPTTIRAALVNFHNQALLETLASDESNPEKMIDKSLETALQYITRIVEEVIGEKSSYNDMCEHCNSWDEGRNDLVYEQAERLRKVLE